MNNPQDISIRIKKLAKSKQVSIGYLLSKCGLNKNALSTMQSGGYLPRIETLTRIADHLECSVDYLLGRAFNVDREEFSEKEKMLIVSYRNTPEMQAAVDRLLNLGTSSNVIELKKSIDCVPKEISLEDQNFFWDNFYKICLLNNTKPNPVAKEIGVSSGVLTKWKNGTIPNGETLIKLSDYFGCSVDDLLGRTS